MEEISRRFPNLSLEHLRELAGIVVERRNAVAAANQVFARATWGIACTACQVVKLHIEELARDGVYPWLRSVREAGMAYTVVVDDVPLRVQPDIDVVRDVMPGERAAMLQVQKLLPIDDEGPSVILRLEVAQRPAMPVDRVTLFLFDEHTNTTLDCEVVYDVAGVGGAESGDESTMSGGTVVPLARPAQDVDPAPRFEFEDLDNVTANDNGRNERN